MYERANINQSFFFLPLSNPLSSALPVYSKVPQVTETFHHPITATNVAVWMGVKICKPLACGRVTHALADSLYRGY